MKKKLILCMLIALGAIMATSCSSDQESTEINEITNLRLSHTTLNLYLGDSKQLTVTPTPSNASIQNLVWTTSDDIVSVSNNGTVTGLKLGTANVTVSTKDKKVSQTAVVRVLCPVAFESENYSLNSGETLKLGLVFLSDSFQKTQLKWESSDPSVATVTNDGTLTAIKAGRSVITAKDPEGRFSVSCNVSVNVPVEGISLDRSNVTLKLGESLQLSATITPDDAANKKLSWSSSDPSVVFVDGQGNIRGLKGGNALITVITEDGNYSASCEVTVIVPAKSISLNSMSLTINKGETSQLIATFVPDNASNKNVSWSSNDPSVASVDENGLVTGLKAGKVVITATTEDGGFTASCEVTVNVPVEGINLNASSVNMPKGKTFQLYATIAPDDAVNKNVSWSSSDSSVVTVDDNGLIKALKQGSATITATTVDGGFSASCDVEVTSTESIEYTPYGQEKVW